MGEGKVPRGNYKQPLKHIGLTSRTNGLITSGNIEDVFVVVDEGVGVFSSRASEYFLYQA